jgi:hypothetical protein
MGSCSIVDIYSGKRKTLQAPYHYNVKPRMPQKFHKITLKLQVKEKNGRKVKCLYFSA